MLAELLTSITARSDRPWTRKITWAILRRNTHVSIFSVCRSQVTHSGKRNCMTFCRSLQQSYCKTTFWIVNLAITFTLLVAFAAINAYAQQLNKLAFQEEFDGPANSLPDLSKWKRETGGKGWGNQELEYYTDSPSNAYMHSKIPHTRTRASRSTRALKICSLE